MTAACQPAAYIRHLSSWEAPMTTDAGRADDPDASGLFPTLYDELRRIADRLLHREAVGHTLQPTALVHEAWFKLAGPHAPQPLDRAHFLAIAARAMRQVLVDHARRRGARKRGGAQVDLTIADDRLGFTIPLDDLLEVDAALTRLGEQSPRLARVVELRFFGGMTIEETASALNISPTVVKDDWRTARALITRMLRDDA